MDFLQKYLSRVFELPLPRNTQNRTKKIKKKVFGVGQVFFKSIKYTPRSVIFFRGPLAKCTPAPQPPKKRKRGAPKKKKIETPVYLADGH
jgi:hypothetical protein